MSHLDAVHVLGERGYVWQREFWPEFGHFLAAAGWKLSLMLEKTAQLWPAGTRHWICNWLNLCRSVFFKVDRKT